MEQEIINCMPLANKLASSFSKGNNADEYRSEAYLALVKAATKFKPNQNNKFSTYAYIVILNALKKYSNKNKSQLNIINDLDLDSLPIDKNETNELKSKNFTPIELTIFELLEQNYNKKEICNLLDIDYNRFYRIKEKIQKKINLVLEI